MGALYIVAAQPNPLGKDTTTPGRAWNENVE